MGRFPTPKMFEVVSNQCYWYMVSNKLVYIMQFWKTFLFNLFINITNPLSRQIESWNTAKNKEVHALEIFSLYLIVLNQPTCGINKLWHRSKLTDFLSWNLMNVCLGLASWIVTFQRKHEWMLGFNLNSVIQK